MLNTHTHTHTHTHTEREEGSDSARAHTHTHIHIYMYTEWKAQMASSMTSMSKCGRMEASFSHCPILSDGLKHDFHEQMRQNGSLLLTLSHPIRWPQA
jgi:hypothetical protein